MKLRFRVLAVPLTLCALATTFAFMTVAADAPALTNADIVKMTKASLGDELIIGKIAQAAKVDFKLDTDDLIALKREGVSQNVISAMLRKTTAKAAPAAASAGSTNEDGLPDATLISAAGSVTLKPAAGDHKQFVAPFVGLRHFLSFDDKAASTRIKDRKPAIEVALAKDPGKHWWFVMLDPDEDDPERGLNLQSAGAWGGAHTFEPDEDAVIQADVTEAKPGVWHFTPKKELKPGEYALYTTKGETGYIYDFGVDK